eukprot:XP_017169680.1 PREDICTED: uncharacterized protein LOC108167830 [Mus musculus]
MLPGDSPLAVASTPISRKDATSRCPSSSRFIQEHFTLQCRNRNPPSNPGAHLKYPTDSSQSPQSRNGSQLFHSSDDTSELESANLPGSFPASYPDLLKFWTRSALTKQKSCTGSTTCHIHPNQQERCNTMLSFFKQVYSGTLHIAMQERESPEQPQGTLNTLLTPPNHPSHVIAVNWFTASDDTSGKLMRHGICAVQVAGM